MFAKTGFALVAAFVSATLAAHVPSHVTGAAAVAAPMPLQPMEQPPVAQPPIAELPPAPPVPIMNSGYISGYFPGSFVTGVRGERQMIGLARPSANILSPGRIYRAGRSVVAPERLVGLRFASPGSEHRGQTIHEAVAATDPRLEMSVRPVRFY